MGTINIQGKEHAFIYGYGAMMMVEETLGCTFGEKRNLYADLTLKYACFVDADRTFPYSFEEFYRLLDADRALREAINAELLRQIERWGKPSEEEGDEVKKN
jgi:hypothetical protein